MWNNIVAILSSRDVPILPLPMPIMYANRCYGPMLWKRRHREGLLVNGPKWHEGSNTIPRGKIVRESRDLVRLPYKFHKSIAGGIKGDHRSPRRRATNNTCRMLVLGSFVLNIFVLFNFARQTMKRGRRVEKLAAAKSFFMRGESSRGL